MLEVYEQPAIAEATTEAGLGFHEGIQFVARGVSSLTAA